MEKRILIDRTDLSVCPIGLGTVGAGLDWDGKAADEVFETYLELGGNLVDSAHVYSDWIAPETARSERVIGDWLSRSGKRQQIVLITKGGHPNMTCEKPDLHQSRMTRKDMIADLDSSLKGLRTDYIDIYFYHRDDVRQSAEELVDVMESFVKEGKIRYYGCSNWGTSRIRAADNYCGEQGYRGFVANQALLNIGLKYMNPMQDDTMESFDSDMLEYHKATPSNLAMPYMGVCSGFFHLYLAKGADSVKNSPYNTKGNLKVAEKVRELMDRYHASVSQVLLGFFTQQEFPCVPLYGPQTIGQLEDAMGTMDIPFVKADFLL
jgi:aryl-alcohol dehydrogenase-like predicted oxidoreductase